MFKGNYNNKLISKLKQTEKDVIVEYTFIK